MSEADERIVNDGIFERLTSEAAAQEFYDRFIADAKFVKKAQADGKDSKQILEGLGVRHADDDLDQIEASVEPFYEEWVIPISKDGLHADLERQLDKQSVETKAIISFLADIFLGGRLPLQNDAPADALDAQECLIRIDRIRSLQEGGHIDGAIVQAIALGYAKCRFDARKAEPFAKAGRKVDAARRKGGSGTRKLSSDEWSLVIAKRDKLTKRYDRSKSWASKKISCQLLTGTFPGIDRCVKVSSNTIARRVVQR